MPLSPFKCHLRGHEIAFTSRSCQALYCYKRGDNDRGIIPPQQSHKYVDMVNKWDDLGWRAMDLFSAGVFRKKGGGGCRQVADFYQNAFEAWISLTLEQLSSRLIKPTYSCTGELNLFSLFKRVITGHSRRYSPRSRG